MPSSDYPVYPPLVTPFADGGVDADALESLVSTLDDRGVDGFVPCGTTGEFASLGPEEYQAVLETTVDAADGSRVVAGVADTSVGGVRSRLETAAAAGSDAALLTLPYFHTANDRSGNLEFLRAVADDSPLPLYLYNIPPYVGTRIEPETVAAAAQLEAVRGLKDSSGDFGYFQALARRTPADFELLQGFDSLLVPSLSFGATGGINALANAIPEVFARTTAAVARGDHGRARTLSDEAIAPLFEQCAEHGFAPATKAAAAARGFVPSADVRPPLVALDADARADVEAAVDRALEYV
jgi:4-hydroxy-tetrahydrodipicolinate synthase